MTVYYALDAQAFETHYLNLGETVSEKSWYDLVTRATTFHRMKRDAAYYLTDSVAPRVEKGRAITGRGVSFNDVGAVIYWAMLSECKVDEWDVGHDTLFMDLIV